MAKTLIGLYDTFGDAEHVRQELVEYGFSRGDVRLVTQDAQHRDAEQTTFGARDVDYNSNLVSNLTDLGVPQADALSYAEGVHRGGSLIVVESSDEWADDGMEILNRVNPVDIHQRRTLWQQEGWMETASGTTVASGMAASAGTTVASGMAASAGTTVASGMAASAPMTNVPRERAHTGRHVEGTEGEVVIPIVEEDITVGKREVERGQVRVHSHVEERPVEEEIRLREEKVTVERRPVDRPATEADLRAAERETVEFTETAEEAVVNKRSRVVEEVVVRRDVHERTETVRGTERRTEVDIDRDPATRTAPVQGGATRGFESYADEYRRHYGSTFASSGAAYTDYEPAYRYGYDLGTNERYRGRDWEGFETDARRDWEQRHPGTWERFKDAIRHGRDRVHSKV